MKLVIVESPAKAKTINKYLGNEYRVLASFGHVRDLPAKNGSVLPENDFEMKWEVSLKSKSHIKAIKDAVKECDSIYLASDPDREGEAISWHVMETLGGEEKLKKKYDVKRVVFHEITKTAILKAMSEPRDLNIDLVEAYFARRALDYLVGFNLSPVLWRKLPGAKSAGRVQSVALRLVTDRESDIEKFKPQEFWTINAEFKTQMGEKFQANLIECDLKKLAKFDIANEQQAQEILETTLNKPYNVTKVEKKRQRRNPYPPFTTSTLQQEASRKLYFSSKQTMQVAQGLYENGFITYMRTDAVSLSNEAVTSARAVVEQLYSDKFLPSTPNVFKNKTKNAQEAHEAVRPTDLAKLPDSLITKLDRDQQRLYDLIWKRTIASQMAPALIDQTIVSILSEDKQATFKANGSTIAFAGFLKLYEEGNDNETESDSKENKKTTKNTAKKEVLLPPLEEHQSLDLGKEPEKNQHFTKPPARFNDASLVKELEAKGIGRPSTYASILSILEARNYVEKDKSRRYIATMKGRLVTEFLGNYFHDIVQYDFTANLENTLDEVANGAEAWKKVLSDFWTHFHAKIEETTEITLRNVLDYLNEKLSYTLFGVDNDNKCPKCDDGHLSLKLGKMGAFIGCSNYPECNVTRQIGKLDEDGKVIVEDMEDNNRELGTDTETGNVIYLKKGPYGHYIQLGDVIEGENKPKRVGVPEGTDLSLVTLESALSFLKLPREVVEYPETGVMITAGIGRYGPFLKHKSKYVSLPKEDNVLTVGANRAIALVSEALSSTPVSDAKELGVHPDDEKPITIQSGRYGPYVKHGRTNATIPKTMEIEDVSFEIALELINKKEEQKGTKKKATKKKTTTKKTATTKKAPAKKTTAKKATTTKKAPAKKTTTKKTTAKKTTTKAKTAEKEKE